jgi:hypothetical protein
MKPEELTELYTIFEKALSHQRIGLSTPPS